jgi:membrane fusion protein (multidrug efflux system)
MTYRFCKTLLFACPAFFAISCGDSKSQAGQQAAPPAIAVNVATVESAPAVYYDNYPATVTPVNEVDLRPQISGYITGIFFKEGQHVNKGEKLYQIDQQQYQGAYEQAVAQLNVSQANLEKSQQDADRYQELAKQDAIARQTLDHALADLEASKRQVEAAKANVSAVSTNLRYATLYAPFSGSIGISQVKLGASVSPGSTVLNTLSSEDPMAVDFAPGEKLIPSLVKWQQAKPSQTDSTFILQLPDQSRYKYSGRIYIIDRAVDPQTGTIRVRLVFPNPGRTLKAGMTGNVLVRNSSAGNALLIPYKSVLEQMSEYFVFVVHGDKVQQQKVTLGQHIGDKVIVKSGLQVNEEVVTDGVQKLREGSAVKVSRQDNPAGGTDSSRIAPADSTKGK